MKIAPIQMALRALYPPQCVLCQTELDREHALCGSCWRDMPFIDGPACDCCGTPILTAGQWCDGDLCESCTQHPHSWDRGRAAVLYQGAARRLVLTLKHGDRPDIAASAGQWMARAGRSFVSGDSVIVPIPLHWRRRISRRYNQADLLAKHVGRILGVDVLPAALTRPKPTVPLEVATAQQRFERLSGAFSVSRGYGARLIGKRVILLDDVMTSGATLGAATCALRDADVHEICTLVLARVPDRDYIGPKQEDTPCQKSKSIPALFADSVTRPNGC